MLHETKIRTYNLLNIGYHNGTLKTGNVIELKNIYQPSIRQPYPKVYIDLCATEYYFSCSLWQIFSPCCSSVLVSL